MKRTSVLLLARVAVTVGLLAWVLTRANLRDVAADVRGARPAWLLLALALCSVNMFVGALRWRLVLRAFGVRFSVGRAVRLCWSGQFFNTFLPSGMVGDAMRSAWAAPGSDPVRATASVLLDRAAAALALAGAVIVGLVLPAGRALGWRAELLAGASMVAILSGALLVFPRAVIAVVLRIGGRPARRWLGKAGVAPLAAVGVWPRGAAVALAAVTEAIIVCTGVALATSVAVPLSLSASLAVIPAAMVTSYLPFSISGMGVRDVALVTLLAQVGIPAGGALAIALLYLGLTWTIGLFGGLVYLATRSPISAAPAPSSTPPETGECPG